jgi:DNA-binding response OmpR family regulator
MRILLVDDDRNVLSATRRILERAGHVIEAHDNDAGALDAFAARPCDAAVLDVNIGDHDGVELSRALRALQPSLRVIFVTGSDESAARAAAYGLVLRKPCSPSDLVKALDA